MTSNVRLEARKLTKVYQTPTGGLEVFKELDFAPEPGSLTALVGASGVGKSTLLHLLGTLDRPSSGSVFFEGRDIYQESRKNLARFRNRAVGFVFQFHHLLPELDAVENVMLPGWMAGSKGYELKKKAKDLLSRVGLENRAQHRPGEMSGGEQQRVAVARALINDPLVILADEPTGNLDGPTGEQLHDLLDSLVRERGQTTVVATHNPLLAGRASAVYRMEAGSLHLEG